MDTAIRDNQGRRLDYKDLLPHLRGLNDWFPTPGLLTASSSEYVVGALIGAGPFLYEVVASGEHLTTKGTKLRVLPDVDGYYAVEAFGVRGDNSIGDRARLQAAVNVTPRLKFQAKTYEFSEFAELPTPNPYSINELRAVVFADQKDIAWRSAGATILKISAAGQFLYPNNASIVFQRDAALFEAPGFEFDQNAVAQGKGSPISCYGVERVRLDDITVRRCGPVRIGASQARMSGWVSATTFTARDCVGVFVLGGKPGGAKKWGPFLHLDVENSRGLFNAELEDANVFGVSTGGVRIVLGKIVGRNIRDGNFPGNASPVECLKVADGALYVTADLVLIEDADGGTSGLAKIVSVKAGQTAVPGGTAVEMVEVDRIIGKNVHGVGVYSEGVETTLGDIVVPAMQLSTVTGAIQVKKTNAHPAGYIKSIRTGWISGHIAQPEGGPGGLAIEVNLDPQADPQVDNNWPPVLKRLDVEGAEVTVKQRSWSIRGVERCNIRKYACTEHQTASVSGGYAGSGVYNVIEADHILLDEVLLAGFLGTSVPLELRPKISCRVKGLVLEAFAGTATALFLNGSGLTIIEGGRIAGATNALHLRPSTGTFNAATAVDIALNRINIPGHVFRHGEQVVYTAGSSPIGGLTDGAVYFVRHVGPNHVELSATLRGAAIDLTSVGAGDATLKKAHTIIAQGIKNECSLIAHANAATNALSLTISGTL